jgi:hypothetical protein
MTDTYKVLGQALTGELALDNSTVKETIVYEVPAGTKASVSAIEITNSDVASQTYKVAFVPSADADYATTNINYSVSSIIDVPFVGVGNAVSSMSTNQALYSLDGIDWSFVTLPSNEIWSKVAYGNGKFVALANRSEFSYSSSIAAISSDGVSWTQATIPAGNYSSIVYGSEKFVAITSNGKIYYSEDGLSWSSGPEYSMVSFKYMIHANGKFVIVGGDGMYSSNKVWYSSNGVSWSESTLPNNGSHSAPVYGDGKFLVFYQGMMDGRVQYSTDLLSWQDVSSPQRTISNSLYVDGKFIILAPGSSSYYSSTDGITWTASTVPWDSMAEFRSFSYGNGKFMVVTNSFTTYYHSVDGVSWNSGTLPFNMSFPGISNLSLSSVQSVSSLQEIVPQSLNKHLAIYNKSIASGETHEIKGGVTLSAGDQIRVYSDSAEIITNVYGVEIA